MNVLIEMFGRHKVFDWKFGLEQAYKQMDVLKSVVTEPQIIDTCSYEVCHFYNYKSDDAVSTNSIIDWTLEKMGWDGKGGTVAAILENSTEDSEWTEWRNRELTDIFYYKATFSEKMQNTIIAEANRIQNEIQKALADEKAREEKEAAEKAAEKAALLNGVKWDTQGKEINDEGGRTYIYVHTIIIGEQTFKIAERSVFDFGRVMNPPQGGLYMKRSGKWIIKTSADQEIQLSEDHQRAAEIVLKYGKFASSYVRM